MLHVLSERFAGSPGDRGQAADKADGRRQEVLDEQKTSAQHDALIAALEQLGERTREHFQHEEDFMRSIDYPDLGAHRCEHALLHAEYVEMVRDLKYQPIVRLDPETVAALRQWIVGHMLAADKEYADFYFAWLEKQDGEASTAVPDSR